MMRHTAQIKVTPGYHEVLFYYPVFIDIRKPFTDINKSVIDITKSFIVFNNSIQ